MPCGMQVEAVKEAQDRQEVMQLSLRCLNLSQGAMQQTSTTAVIARPAQPSPETDPDPEVQEAVLRLSTAKAIRDAVALADARNFPGYDRLLLCNEVRSNQHVRSWRPSTQTCCLLALSRLILMLLNQVWPDASCENACMSPLTQDHGVSAFSCRYASC